MRPSAYIDFDSCITKLAPMTLQDRLTMPWTDDDKIKLFECRVDVWLFGPAMLMLRSIENASLPSTWCHAAYGMFTIVLPYFEMIGKILNPGSKSQGTSGTDFNIGFCDVYPLFRPPNAIYSDNILVSGGSSRQNLDIQHVVAFRNRTRNGMFHVGYTKQGVLIHGDSARQDVEEQGGNYLVNIHKMPITVVHHFPGLMDRIRNDSQIQNQFLAYFNSMLLP